MFFFEMKPSEFDFHIFVIFCLIMNYGFLFLYIQLSSSSIPIENIDNNKNQTHQITKQIPLFSPELYLKKYKSMEKSNLTEIEMKNLRNSFIIEKTPLGNVLLYYDTNENSFQYYSDNSIPYRYLEICARKYVTTYFCTQFYIDFDIEIQNARDKIKQQQTVTNIEKEKVVIPQTPTNNMIKSKSPFVKFKTYNNNTQNNTQKVLENPIQPNQKTSSTSLKKQRPIILKEQVNRYKYLGKMCNFSFIKKTDDGLKTIIDEKVSYKEFMMMKTKKNNELL